MWQLPAAAKTTDNFPDEVELGYSHEALSNNYPSWKSNYLDYSHRFGERHSVYAELRETRRFNLDDRELSGGYYHPLGESWTALIEASTSPSHKVLASNSLYGQLQKSLGDGWDIQAGMRHSNYTAVSSNMLVLTGEHYWSSFRVAYRLFLSRLQGSGAAPSHNAQLSYYYTDRDNITLNYTRGRQVDSLGPALGVRSVDVTSSSLTGRHWIDPSWGLSYEVIMERQGNLYTRTGFRLGLRYAY